MNELQKLRNEMGKVKPEKLRIKTNNIVAYCRVSDPRQAKDGESVESQLESIEDFCLENNFYIKKTMLLEGESSKKGAERPSINELIKYVRNSRNKISNVVVFHSSRFTRDMLFGGQIIDELINLGIGFIDISSPLDIFTTSGRLEQIDRFKDAEKDNNTRKVFTHTGLMRKLRQGQTMQKAPLGYTRHWIGTKRNKTQKVVINEDGEILKNAFKMKIEDNLSNVEIAKRITNMGLNVSAKQIGKVFKNMYYCGLIKDVRLVKEGGIVEGMHPAMISIEDYRLINGLASPLRGIKKKTDRPELPLRRQMVCPHCGSTFSGEAKKKEINSYYRCSNPHCKESTNVSTHLVHDSYAELLGQLQIKEELTDVLRHQLIGFLSDLNVNNQSKINLINGKIKENQKTINSALRAGLHDPKEKKRYESLIEDIEKENRGYDEELSTCFGEIKDINRTCNQAIELMKNIKDMVSLRGTTSCLVRI